MTFLKFLMLLTLSLWLGGIIFFTAVEAPAILNHVPDRALGGAIINQSLEKLHWMGIVCGLVFLLASLLRSYAATRETRLLTLPHLTVIAMIACTEVSQRFILPAIAQLRAAHTDPSAQMQFQRLHNGSVGLEGAVLLLGLALLYLQACDAT
ncbi:MAG TPA: DUF4149 domain-containing protein [Terriglobales bacterium]|nr:DUF4149 domain-containing protein [Terriglobales bacterium]